MAKKKSKDIVEELALLCVNASLDKKAKNVSVIFIGDVSSVADYFVVCTGTSDRHVMAVSESVQERIKKAGYLPRGVEGKNYGNWILLDYGDVIVHIFLESVRQFYELERLFVKAPIMDVPDDIYEIAELKFKTVGAGVRNA